MDDRNLLHQAYSFPPLFTSQPNESSRRKQWGIWRDILILKKVFLISQGGAIFRNSKINRRFYVLLFLCILIRWTGLSCHIWIVWIPCIV